MSNTNVTNNSNSYRISISIYKSFCFLILDTSFSIRNNSHFHISKGSDEDIKLKNLLDITFDGKPLQESFIRVISHEEAKHLEKMFIMLNIPVEVADKRVTDD